MAEAVIVEAVRPPIGKRNGGLSGLHPADLSAQVPNVLVERPGIDPRIVDDGIWGCVMQAGEQALATGRTAVLTAGWPESAPRVARYSETPNQGIGAEMIAERWGFGRKTLDEFSLGSHRKAAAAQNSAAVDDQIVTIEDQDGDTVLKNDGIRRGTTIETMAQLKPAFKKDGVIAAAGVVFRIFALVISEDAKEGLRAFAEKRQPVGKAR